MRNGFAMADGGHGDTAASAAWFAPVLAFVSAIAAATILFFARRLVGKAAWETAMATANKDLIDQLQEERRDFIQMRNAERIEWASERSQLHGEIINLTQAFESLKSYLRREGINVPETAYHPFAGVIVIEESDQ